MSVNGLRIRRRFNPGTAPPSTPSYAFPLSTFMHQAHIPQSLVILSLGESFQKDYSSTFTSSSKLELSPSTLFPCYYGHVTASSCLTTDQLCSSGQTPVRQALLMFRQHKWKNMENCIRPLNTLKP